MYTAFCTDSCLAITFDVISLRQLNYTILLYFYSILYLYLSKEILQISFSYFLVKNTIWY